MNGNDSHHHTGPRRSRARRIRRGRASIVLVLDRLDRPSSFYVVGVDGLDHYEALERAANVAFAALVRALEQGVAA